MQGERRKNSRQPFCQHRLAASRCTDHQQVMTTGSRHFQSTLDTLLPAYIGEIELKLLLAGIKFFPRVHDSRLQFTLSTHELDYLFDGRSPVHLQIIDYRSFSCILPGKDKALEALFPRFDGDRQHSFHRLQATVERKFSHQDELIHPGSIQLFSSSQYADSQRQIIGRTFFPDIGRRHIDHNTITGEFISAHLKGRDDTFVTFAYGNIGETDQKELDSLRTIDFNGDNGCRDALHRGGIRFD